MGRLPLHCLLLCFMPILAVAGEMVLSEAMPVVACELAVEWRSPRPPATRETPPAATEPPLAFRAATGGHWFSDSMAVSADGQFVFDGSATIYDLRTRAPLNCQGSPGGDLLGFADGGLWFAAQRIDLATGAVRPLPACTSRDLLLPALLARTPAVMPRITDPAIGAIGTVKAWAIPGTSHAFGIIGQEKTSGTWAAFILDLAGKRTVACVRNADPSRGGIRNEFKPHRLALALADAPALGAELRRSYLASGAFRRLQRVYWDGRLLSLRIADDRVVGDPWTPVPGARALAWSEDGRIICTRHDDRLQVWSEDWRPLAAMPLLERMSLAQNSCPSGMFQASSSVNWLVDCRDLTCVRDPRGNGLDPRHCYARISPAGVEALSGQWPKRSIALLPPGHDWRSVLEATICANATGVTITERAVHLRRLPDGPLHSVTSGLPGPPYGVLSDIDGRTVVLVGERSLVALDAENGRIAWSKPLTGDRSALQALSHREERRVSGRGAIGDDWYQVVCGPRLQLRLVTPTLSWPLFASGDGRTTLDATTGQVGFDMSTRRFPACIVPPPGWSIRSINAPQIATDRWPIELVDAQQRTRWGMFDPRGANPPHLAPAIPDARFEGSRPIGDGVYAAPVINAGSGIYVWNAQTGGWARLFPQPDGSVVAWSDDGHFAVPRRHADSVSLVVNGHQVRCGTYDLQRNRPDRVLRRIGLTDPEHLALLEAAWERRLRRAGLDPAQVAAAADPTTLPAVRFASLPPARTPSAQLLLACNLVDGDRRNLQVAVRVGGLELARMPLPAGDPGTERRFDVPVALHAGINEIVLEPLLEDGTAGLPAMVTVVRTADPGGVRLAAIGISRYRDQERDLAYAGADARDAAVALCRGPASRALVLTDAEASAGALPALRSHLASASADDLAVVLVAAHGLVDSRGIYRIACHDTDFADPASRSLALDDLLAALRASPARRRLLLLDTCHAGELDDAAVQHAGPAPDRARTRGLRRPAEAKPPPSPPRKPEPSPGQVARALFQDAGWSDGITVLAACRGDEQSWESEAWGHGAFSHALIEGVGERRADLDGDGDVDLAELGRHIMERVPQLTGDRQHPEVRAGDLDRNIVIVPPK